MSTIHKLISGGHSRWVVDHHEDHQSRDPQTCMMIDLTDAEITALGNRIVLVSSGEPEKKSPFAELLKLNAPVIADGISGFSLADLKALLAEEEAGEARKGLIKVINNLIEEKSK